MPDDLIATNSNDSPRLPKVMIEEINKASGKASGTQVIATTPIRYMSVLKSNPLPTKSSIYNQKNCMINTNSDIRKVAIKGPINERNMSKSNFLITNCFFVVCSLFTNELY